MTREEAIEFGNMWLEVNEDSQNSHTYKFFAKAIQALEQEPIGDAISRQAVLDLCDRFDDGVPYSVLSNYDILPSVNTKKTGHWISHRDHCENLGVVPSGLGAYEWCSNCDCGIDVREWYRNHYNYCPNCGADMKGAEE